MFGWLGIHLSFCSEEGGELLFCVLWCQAYGLVEGSVADPDLDVGECYGAVKSHSTCGTARGSAPASVGLRNTGPA